MKTRALLLFVLLVLNQSCIVVGGYSNTDGWFIWPGGLLISFLLVLILYSLVRRRRF